MKAFHLTRFGLEHLQPQEAPRPTPGPHEVLVQVQALALNALDLMVINGVLPIQLPHTPIGDAAGTVVAVGDQVTALAVGDEVTSVFFPLWREGDPKPEQTVPGQRTGVGRPGYLAEYVVVPATALVRKPANLSLVEAATLPVAGLTAWNALRYTQLQPGETLLVHGTGGVSLFGLQFAKARGCRVAITSKDDAKLARARELGADFTFNYATQPHWVDELVAQTGGVDAVIETVGGRNLSLSLKALAMRGRIAIMGLQQGMEAPLDVLTLLAKQASITGMQVGSVADMTAMNRAIEASNLHPVVDQVYPVADVHRALRALQEGSQFGKICLTF